MSTPLDTNDLSGARQGGYFILRSDDPVAGWGGLVLYLLSGAQLISALQARVILFLRNLPEATTIRHLAELPGSRYRPADLIPSPMVDGIWGPKTTAALYVVCRAVGYPVEICEAIKQTFTQRQISMGAVRAAIHLSYFLPAPSPGSDLPTSADLAKATAGIVLRLSEVKSGETVSQIRLPLWLGRTAVSAEAPRRTTVNAALSSGLTFTPGVVPLPVQPPVRPGSVPGMIRPTTAEPPVDDMFDRFGPVRPPPRDAAPPTTTPPRDPAPPNVPPPPRPPATEISRASSAGVVGVLALGLVGLAVVASKPKGKGSRPMF